MGLTLIKVALATKGMTLAIGSEKPGFDEAAFQAQLLAAGCPHLPITSDPDSLAKSADAVIDFTTPQATLEVARAVAKKSGIHIIGTTGFSEAQQEEIKRLASRARIVQAGNFSLGVAALEKLVSEAAAMLGDAYDIEIFEMHHKHKKDAPSGTALMLGRAAAEARKNPVLTLRVPQDNSPRKTGEIGLSYARGGDVVGIHSVTFAGPGEIIELKHQGFNREIYAAGALKAAHWARDKKPGLYSVRDVLASADNS
ncbi:MAG: 4-hydroxy-tetrahydrodipicolinate reductase [Pseudomonadota bacterium]|nr:4-hydroxy-tetrahydrodipicolinate reductase [Pseudomonadota bacterium]MDE3037844.1 4-hydroxy-tetrahydrodipicolinate reductase [Pseudomonadota bacterium]